MPEEPSTDIQRELRRIRLVLLGQWLLFALIFCGISLHFWAESLRPPVMPGMESLAIQAELRALREELKKQGNQPGQPQVVPGKGGDKATLDAFMRAAEEGQVGRVEHLLKEGIHVNERDAEGQTALMRAAAKGQAGVARALLDRKALAAEQDKLGQTAAMQAAKNGQRPIILLLKNHFKENEQLITIFQMWAIRDKEGRSALFHAAMAGHAEIVSDLVEADPFLRDSEGRTALMAAAERGHAAVVRALLSSSTYARNNYANTKEKDKTGKTALQLAEEKGHKAVVELLKK